MISVRSTQLADLSGPLLANGLLGLKESVSPMLGHRDRRSGLAVISPLAGCLWRIWRGDEVLATRAP